MDEHIKTKLEFWANSSFDVRMNFFPFPNTNLSVPGFTYQSFCLTQYCSHLQPTFYYLFIYFWLTKVRASTTICYIWRIANSLQSQQISWCHCGAACRMTLIQDAPCKLLHPVYSSCTVLHTLQPTSTPTPLKTELTSICCTCGEKYSPHLFALCSRK